MKSAAESDFVNHIVIRPPAGLSAVNAGELWEYRELAYFLAWKEVKVRYKQTALGVLWAVFQPLAGMAVFTVFFGKLAKIPSDGVPYPLFVYTGLLFWNYFSSCITRSSESIIGNASIIQKVYFPRLLIPISVSLAGLVDFAVSAVLLAGLMAYYGYAPGAAFAFFAPLFLLMTFLSAVGIGSFLGALNVRYRDVRYVVPFFIQMLLFLTPVIYPVSMVGAKYGWILAANPMSGVIEAARFYLFGTGAFALKSFFVSAAMSLLLFAAGMLYFRKAESFFADII
jgi:lipopolysaccharide transport system permease protein